MNTPWSLLSNARLIDWVLESLRTRSEVWDQLWMSWDASRTPAWNTARMSVRLPIERAPIWGMARAATRDATRDANGGWTGSVDYGVILALISYDDCDQYLDMTYDQLLIYAILSERPQAVLLLPLKWIQEHETLVTST